MLLQADWACAWPAAGTVFLTTSLQTCSATFLTPARSPLAALSQASDSFDLSAASSVGAELIAFLHAATAAATCGLAEPPPELLVVVEPPEVVVEPPDVVVLGVDDVVPPPDEELLLLLPQPATTAPLRTTTDNNALSLLAMGAPL
jgi:hypothetical protein